MCCFRRQRLNSGKQIDRLPALQFRAIEDDPELRGRLAFVASLSLSDVTNQPGSVAEDYLSVLPHILANSSDYLIPRLGFAGINRLGELRINGGISRKAGRGATFSR